jgi:hypothetical protein
LFSHTYRECAILSANMRATSLKTAGQVFKSHIQKMIRHENLLDASVRIEDVTPITQASHLNLLAQRFCNNYILLWPNKSTGRLELQKLEVNQHTPPWIKKRLLPGVARARYFVEFVFHYHGVDRIGNAFILNGATPGDTKRILDPVSGSYRTWSQEIRVHDPKVSRDWVNGFGQLTDHFEAWVEKKCSGCALIGHQGDATGESYSLFSTDKAEKHWDDTKQCAQLDYIWLGEIGWSDISAEYESNSHTFKIHVGGWSKVFESKDGTLSDCCPDCPPSPPIEPLYIPPPKTLPGFPDAKRVKSKSQRARWLLPDGDILEWDSLHGKVERYDKRGKHKGEFDPETGKQTKPADPSRYIEPILLPRIGG